MQTMAKLVELTDSANLGNLKSWTFVTWSKEGVSGGTFKVTHVGGDSREKQRLRSQLFQDLGVPFSGEFKGKTILYCMGPLNQRTLPFSWSPPPHQKNTRHPPLKERPSANGRPSSCRPVWSSWPWRRPAPTPQRCRAPQLGAVSSGILWDALKERCGKSFNGKKGYSEWSLTCDLGLGTDSCSFPSPIRPSGGLAHLARLLWPN